MYKIYLGGRILILFPLSTSEVYNLLNKMIFEKAEIHHRKLQISYIY